jgi:hypothetical protein
MLRDFLRIGLAGIEICCGGDYILWDFLRFGLVGIEIFCGRNSHSCGFPEDWFSRLRDILRREFAFFGIS